MQSAAFHWYRVRQQEWQDHKTSCHKLTKILVMKVCHWILTLPLKINANITPKMTLLHNEQYYTL